MVGQIEKKFQEKIIFIIKNRKVRKIFSFMKIVPLQIGYKTKGVP